MTPLDDLLFGEAAKRAHRGRLLWPVSVLHTQPSCVQYGIVPTRLLQLVDYHLDFQLYFPKQHAPQTSCPSILLFRHHPNNMTAAACLRQACHWQLAARIASRFVGAAVHTTFCNFKSLARVRIWPADLPLSPLSWALFRPRYVSDSPTRYKARCNLTATFGPCLTLRSFCGLRAHAELCAWKSFFDRTRGWDETWPLRAMSVQERVRLQCRYYTMRPPVHARQLISQDPPACQTLAA
eukprot:363283-Chlamydomonas_euryale.AAC.8